MSKISEQPRLWRSPGEKKIIEPTQQAKDVSNPELERTKKLKDNKDKNRGKHNETRHHDESLTKKCSISPLIDSRSRLTTSAGLLQVQVDSNAVRFTSLNDKGSRNDPILNRMQEIDLKLMQYQDQKMKIDEIILKYQKEKMTIEQMTMQLQNERFQLLSSMLASSNNANTQLLASSGLPKMRPNEPLTIVVAKTEVPSAIDLTKAEMSNADKTMKIKHKKSNSKKRTLELEHKDVEHRSKKSKLSPKESSHSKHSKSKSSSDTGIKCATTLNEPLREHSQKSKWNDIVDAKVVDLTIDERPTAKTSTAVISRKSNSRHLITKECYIKLKRYTRHELNMILSSPLPSDTSKTDTVISSFTTSNLESESESESIEPDVTVDPKIQPKADYKKVESDFLGFLTPTSNFDGPFLGHRMPIVFMQVSVFFNFCM